jgi:hypothetical protein
MVDKRIQSCSADFKMRLSRIVDCGVRPQKTHDFDDRLLVVAARIRLCKADAPAEESGA